MADGILIPSGGKMKSYACLRSLNRRGIRTIVASESESVPHFASRYCSEPVTLSSSPGDLGAYKDALLDLASRSDVKSIVPVRECDAYLFAKYQDAFEEHVSLVNPDLTTLRKAHDRYRLANEAEAAGVPVAETALLSEVTDWSRNVVVKSRFNLLTPDYVDSMPADTVAENKQIVFLEAGEQPDVDDVREDMGHEPIVQAFVPQREKYLYCALWDHGEPLATYQHKQLRQNSWVGGGGVYRESRYSETVDEIASTLLEQLDWHGFACIEFLRDDVTGEWKFLEINPRIWQSMPEAVRADADFPLYYWHRAMGQADRIDPGYETGRLCHNAYGEIAHLLSIRNDDSPFRERPSFVRTGWDILTSSLLHPRFEYIRRDDPRFFLRALRKTVSTGVNQSRHYAEGDTETAPPSLREVEATES